MNSLADKKNTLTRVRWGVFDVFIEVEKPNSQYVVRSTYFVESALFTNYGPNTTPLLQQICVTRENI